MYSYGVYIVYGGRRSMRERKACVSLNPGTQRHYQRDSRERKKRARGTHAHRDTKRHREIDKEEGTQRTVTFGHERQVYAHDALAQPKRRTGPAQPVERNGVKQNPMHSHAVIESYRLVTLPCCVLYALRRAHRRGNDHTHTLPPPFWVPLCSTAPVR